MRQYKYNKVNTIELEISKADVGASGVVVARLPEGARILGVNVTVDEAFDGATANTITVGVAGAVDKFQSAVSLASVSGNNSARQHTVTDTTKDVIMSIAGTTATTGSGTVTVLYRDPSKYVIGQ